MDRLWPLFSLLLLLLLLLPLTNNAASSTMLDQPPTLTFDDAYTQVFGDGNLMVAKDGRAVHLSLDKRTGAGFASQELYLHGFFSASIKLPPHYAAGVVVALYMSNGDVFEENHDELDFEFLGNVRGKEWRVQTNVYGNGSTGVGREERYALWFDPTAEFHHYSILWSHHRIVFYIDNVPIREILRPSGGNTGVAAFPSKPMSLYATVWDGSDWATSGGRYKVNYKYAPYVAEFSDLVIHGCTVDPMDHSSSTCEDGSDPRHYDGFVMPLEQRAAMEAFRREYTSYSYCYDRERYPAPPAECGGVDAAAPDELSNGRRFRQSGGVRIGHHRHQRHHRSRGDGKGEQSASMAAAGSRTTSQD